MPKFPKPCVECGVITRESRCPEHRLPDRRPSKVRRGSSQERAKMRLRALRRGKYRCSRCGFTDKTGKELQVDHILPSERGGPNTIENLQVLCIPCHAEKTRAESEDRQFRF